ncbi:hypothetical protein [Shewanella sp. 10N.286.48.B5]|uniref:hypothetical protein n=1 Tax=Shewanella sp. 10N.286.48.B5 TaxID=1880834 RepID=UPI000C855EFF|nr:hypothetical protein [Shewanella sp. 10N.286.48.B5]PMH86293.1 hypothetical protein BCU57_11185 [Shewanella sp. 10N.286.48.B5]
MKVERKYSKGRTCLSIEECTSLEILSEHPDIDALFIRHFPKIEGLDLNPIVNCKQLSELSLSTIPGWDGSGKTLKIKSFSPLAELKNLKEIRVLDVIPLEDGIEPLKEIKSLNSINLARKYYQLEDYASIKSALPMIQGLEPIKQMNFKSLCSKCNKYPELYLEGTKPRARAYVCPKCNIKAINKHLERWKIANGTPSYEEFIGATPEDLHKQFGKPEYA